MTAPGLYPEHDLFIQLMKLKNTLRHLRGEELITHLGPRVLRLRRAGSAFRRALRYLSNLSTASLARASAEAASPAVASTA